MPAVRPFLRRHLVRIVLFLVLAGGYWPAMRLLDAWKTSATGPVSFTFEYRFLEERFKDAPHLLPPAARIQRVLLSGTFVLWSIGADAPVMRPVAPGRWETALRLPPGQAVYKFVVFLHGSAEPLWVEDFAAGAFVPDGYGGRNSVLSTSSLAEVLDLGRALWPWLLLVLVAFTVLEFAIRGLLRVRISLRLKLAAVFALLSVGGSALFVTLSGTQRRALVERAGIEAANLLHLACAAQGVDFARLDGPGAAAFLEAALRRFFAFATLYRPDARGFSNGQQAFSSAFFTAPDGRLLAFGGLPAELARDAAQAGGADALRDRMDARMRELLRAVGGGRELREPRYYASYEIPSALWATPSIEEKRGVFGPFRWDALCVPVLSGGVVRGYWLLGFDPDAQRELLSSAGRYDLLLAAALALLALVLVAQAGRVVLRPLSGLIAAMRDVQAGNLARTVEIRTRDEVEDLGAAFNYMARELAASYEQISGHAAELEHKVAERTRELAEAKGEIERASEEKTYLFVNLAHETKTPLTLIANYLDRYLKRHPYDEELAVVRREVEKMSTDVVNYLDLEKLSRGLDLYDHTLVTDLSALVERAGALYRGAAEEKGLALTVAAARGVRVAGDPAALERALNNLVVNALKFTDPGGTVAVRLAATDGRARLSVADTGIGIPADQLAHVFEPYHQVTRAKRNAQGIGMGLAIVSRIARDLGGGITAASEVGQGTTFTIELPASSTLPSTSLRERSLSEVEGRSLSPVEGAASASPVILPRVAPRTVADTPFDKARQTLLVVEDNTELLALLVAELGEKHNVFAAKNGIEALAKLKSMPAPDLIVSDVMMDGMDGYELFANVLADERLSATPFIFLTARTAFDEKLARLTEGAVDYLHKPFAAAELKARVAALAGQRRKQRAAGLAEAIAAIRERAVLTPDDAEAGRETRFAEACARLGVTDREREVARLIDAGLEHKEIAARLCISPKTVGRHVENLYAKTGAGNKVELVNRLFG